MATSQLIVRLVDGVSGPAKAAGASLKRLVGAAKHANTGIARAQADLNRQIKANQRALGQARWQMMDAIALGYAAARAITAPITAARDYQTALEDIRQKTGQSRKETAAFGDRLRALTKDTNQTTEALLRAANAALGLAGDLPMDAQMALFKSAGRAATAYRADIEELSKTGVAAYVNLKVAAEDLPKVFDILGYGAAKGGFEIPDLAQYFPDLASSYAAQAPDADPLEAVNEVSAAIQTVRKSTGDSASAATYLRSVFTKFGDPSTTAAFKKFAGMDLGARMKELREEGMSAVDIMIKLTEEATKGDEAMYNKLFGRIQTRLAMMALVRDQEFFRELRGEGDEAAGFTTEQYERRIETFQAKMRKWKAQLENFQISLGATLLPVITDVVGHLGAFVEGVGGLIEKFPQATSAIATAAGALVAFRIAAAAINFSRLFAFGALLQAKGILLGLARAVTKIGAGFAALTGVKGATTALGWLARSGAAFGVAGAGLAAIGAAIKLIADNWSGIKSFFGGVGQGFMDGMSEAVGEENMAAIRAAVDDLESILNFDLGFSNEQWREWGQTLGNIAGQGVGALVEGFRRLVGFIRDAAQAVKDFINWASGLGDVSMPSVTGGAVNTPRMNDPLGSKRLQSLPKRAAGGPVGAGQSYIVGERGPELFRPTTGGRIEANAKGGGAVTVAPVFNFRIAGAADPRAIEQHVRRALDDYVTEAFRGVQSDAGAKVF